MSDPLTNIGNIPSQATQSLAPDLEKGPDEPKKPSGDGPPPPPTDDTQSIDDDSDNNDKFWKLFLDEAAAEAKWKVEIWKTELDSLLVFVGLFAAVISAFLVDLRFHLRPDPQLVALNRIASILLNDTASVEMEQPSIIVLATGSLWYTSLVVTLIGALWSVLAKGWLGEILREPPNNPADRALERWKRDNAARNWHMDSVITGVPLLTQIGLGMFLAGFVVQSFDDNQHIGVAVLVLVGLGAFAYALFTVLPWFFPDCPYRTPLTKFLHLVPTTIFPINITRDDTETDPKIQILRSRLNRSANDEIFCAAASMLDAKLEGNSWEIWYTGLRRQGSDIAEALSLRLQSFAHRVQMVTEGPSSLILKDTTGSSTSREAFVGALYLPIEQGIACLRVLLKSIEASLSSDGGESPWIKQDIDRQWRSSKIFPETWRLLSLSIHITRLVVKKADYDKDDLATTPSDWENMIRKTFFDLTLRSTVGASACRGLLKGKTVLKRVCALGLAMFFEVEATIPADSLNGGKQIFFDNDWATKVGKLIIESLWDELIKIWRNVLAQALVREVPEWGEPPTSVFNPELIKKDLYKNEVNSSIPRVIRQLDSKSWREWATRKQALETLANLCEQKQFRASLMSEGAISKVISKLEDDDEDVRAAAITALSTFGKQAVFTETMKAEGVIARLVNTRIKDSDSDVQVAASTALRTFISDAYHVYQNDIESSITILIKQQLDDKVWIIRYNTIRLLIELSEHDIIRQKMNSDGVILRLVAKLEDSDSDYVRSNALVALRAFSTYELYHADIRSSIPTIIMRVDDRYWDTQREAINTLTTLSESVVFQEAILNSMAITKLVEKLDDDDEDVRTAAIQAFSALRKKSYFKEVLESQNVFSRLFDKLKDNNDDVHSAAIHVVTAFITDRIYNESITPTVSISTFVKELQDVDHRSTRHKAIKDLIQFAPNVDLQASLNSEKIISKLVDKLMNDRDQGVCTAAALALSVFGAQEAFQKALKSESSILKLTMKLSDSFPSIRSAAQDSILTLSAQDCYRDDIKAVIRTLIKQLDDKNRATSQIIQLLVKLSENASFQETIKNEGFVTKLMVKLGDRSEGILSTAAQALSTLGMIGVFKQKMKDERAVPKLIAKLKDNDGDVRPAVYNALLALGKGQTVQEDVTEFLQTVVSTLNTIDVSVRIEVYKVLVELRIASPDSVAFLTKIDTAICELLTQMKDKELPFIQQSVAVLTEAANSGLIGNDLKNSNTSNSAARDAVETVVRSKLVYVNNSPDRSRVVLALARLAKHEIFLDYLKPAIPGLVEAVGDNDLNVWSAAIGAISPLSENAELLPDLQPALKKLIPKLSAWGEDEGHDRNPTPNRLHGTYDSLTEDLPNLVANFIKHGSLTMNDRIALASALRIASVGRTASEIQVCKLNVAALLVPASKLSTSSSDASPDSASDTSSEASKDEVPLSDPDYASFLGVILGTGNNNLTSKLAMLLPQKA